VLLCSGIVVFLSAFRVRLAAERPFPERPVPERPAADGAQPEGA
jgi:hypothetical protein